VNDVVVLAVVLLLVASGYAAGRVHGQIGYREGYRSGYRQGFADGTRNRPARTGGGGEVQLTGAAGHDPSERRQPRSSQLPSVHTVGQGQG
jgi:hypothetical protein